MNDLSPWCLFFDDCVSFNLSFGMLFSSYIKYSKDVIEGSPDQLDGEVDQVLSLWPSHIVVSKKNQEEIFASLSKNDFKKIISNL